MADIIRVGYKRTNTEYDEAGNAYTYTTWVNGPTNVVLVPPFNAQIAGFLAGAALNPGDACYINTDGKVYPSIGTTAGALASKVVGYAAAAAAIGQPVTLYKGLIWNYSTGMTPGPVYLSATAAGNIGTAATVGGTAPIGYIVSSTLVQLNASDY